MREAPQHWVRVKQVLNLAMDASPAERATVLREACDGDSVLESDVESLLLYANETGKLDDCLHETVSSMIWSAEAPVRIGPYRIERVLGSGGMGTVYLGVRDDDELPAQVALKVIQAGSSGALLERFRRERKILSGLIHPYIARLLDGGKLDDGRPYFVMEYVDGQTIDQYVASHQLGILELFLKVCSAVQFAHQSLVIHRDIKPGNILVTASGEPRLLDFGIARLLAGDGPSAESEMTQPRERMLTPLSASPEQAGGEAVTMASDVYSLGVLLYRLLTGVSPYAGARNLGTDPVRVIREFEPPLASTAANLTRRARALLEGDLDNILRKALEKDPSRRFQTAHEFSADIERHLKGLPVEACPASFAYRAAKFIRRNRVAVGAAALVGLALTGGLLGTSLYAHRARQEQMRAQRELSALRKLTQSFLFEFDDAIKDLPGSSAAQELVVHRAEEYVDKIASEAGDDPVLLNDLADAYTHIVRLIGRFQEARGGSSPRSGLENALKALAIRRRLYALSPNDEKVRVQLEDSIWYTAGLYSTIDDLPHASELYQEHLRMCENALKHPSFVDELYGLGTSLTSNGRVERALGHYDTSLAYQRRGLAVREGLLKADPTSARARRVVAISHQFLGYTMSSQRDYAGAAEEHRRAVELIEPLARAAPRNADLQRIAAEAREDLCESRALGGAAKEALGDCQVALALYRGMTAADPTNLQAFEDLASGENTMSVALDLAHSPHEAFEHQRQARELFESAINRDPDGPDLMRENATSLMELAKLKKQLHIDGARSSAEEAVRDLERLAARSPQSRVIGDLLQEAKDLYASIR
ncbi:MAG: protein kinase [Bryobacteraceae bacterium]|jgi:tetratricopeptide (TPR) repeat protein